MSEVVDAYQYRRNLNVRMEEGVESVEAGAALRVAARQVNSAALYVNLARNLVTVDELREQLSRKRPRIAADLAHCQDIFVANNAELLGRYICGY